MEEVEVRQLLVRVLNRQPGLVFDLVEQPDPAAPGAAPPDPRPSGPGPAPPGPAPPKPAWCRCNNCHEMQTDLERLCCNCLPQNCTSERPVSTLSVSCELS